MDKVSPPNAHGFFIFRIGQSIDYRFGKIHVMRKQNGKRLAGRNRTQEDGIFFRAPIYFLQPLQQDIQRWLIVVHIASRAAFGAAVIACQKPMPQIQSYCIRRPAAVILANNGRLAVFVRCYNLTCREKKTVRSQDGFRRTAINSQSCLPGIVQRPRQRSFLKRQAFLLPRRNGFRKTKQVSHGISQRLHRH